MYISISCGNSDSVVLARRCSTRHGDPYLDWAVPSGYRDGRLHEGPAPFQRYAFTGLCSCELPRTWYMLAQHGGNVSSWSDRHQEFLTESAPRRSCSV